MLLKQQRENTRLDETVTQTLGWALSSSSPLTPCLLLFKVVVNQAKGADDKMRLGVSGSGRKPGLGAGPSSQPLHLHLQQPQLPGSAPPHRPCLNSPAPPTRTPLHLPGGWWTPGDHADSETEPGQARNRQPGS